MRRRTSRRDGRTRRRWFGRVALSAGALCLGMSLAGCQTQDAARAGGDDSASSPPIYLMVAESERRAATEQDTARARTAATELWASLSETERATLSKQRARIAVLVGVSERVHHVMILDARSLEFVDGVVYGFPRQSLGDTTSDHAGDNVRFGVIGGRRVKFRL